MPARFEFTLLSDENVSNLLAALTRARHELNEHQTDYGEDLTCHSGQASRNNHPQCGTRQDLQNRMDSAINEFAEAYAVEFDRLVRMGYLPAINILEHRRSELRADVWPLMEALVLELTFVGGELALAKIANSLAKYPWFARLGKTIEVSDIIRQRARSVARMSEARIAAHMVDRAVNELKVPLNYLHNVAEVTGKPVAEIAARYLDLKARGADFVTLIDDYVKSNRYGITIEDAHLIMGYTTNIFQKGLSKKIRDGVPLTAAETRLHGDIVNAMAKLPSVDGAYVRGLGGVGSDFDMRYAPGSVIREPDFASVSLELMDNYPANRILYFRSAEAKDLSDLAMDTKFAEFIDQIPTEKEFVLMPNKNYHVISNDGVTVTLEEVM